MVLRPNFLRYPAIPAGRVTHPAPRLSASYGGSDLAAGTSDRVFSNKEIIHAFCKERSVGLHIRGGDPGSRRVCTPAGTGAAAARNPYAGQPGEPVRDRT